MFDSSAPRGRLWMALLGGLLLLALGLGVERWRSGGDLDKAARLLAGGEPQSAMLELKSLLQKAPELAEARLLLGRVHLTLNDPASAEAEFGRALQAGLPLPTVAAPLADALLAQGRGREVIDRLAALQPGDAAEAAALQTTVARAHLQAGDPTQARAALARAQRIVPNHPPSKLVEARLLAGAGDFKAAQSLVDEVLARDPRHGPGWALKGDLLRVQPDAASAAQADAAYGQALAADPRLLQAHEGRVTVRLRMGDLPAARSAWSAMSSAHPGNGVTAYLDVVLSLKEGQPERARDAAQRLLQAGAESAQLRVLAGQAAAQLGSWAQAQAHFGKAVALAPADAVPRLHLALAWLRQGQPSRALETLQPLLAAKSGQDQAWALAAQAHLAQGEFGRASAAFERALRAAPDNVALRAQRAQAAVLAGRPEQGLSELMSLAQADPGTTADLALITQHLGTRSYDQALRAIDGMARKAPQLPLVHLLRGQVALARQDLPGARSHLQQALTLNPSDGTALRLLAQIDVADGKPQAAVDRFEAVLQRDPGQVFALLGVVEFGRLSGLAPKELLARLEPALRAQPSEPRLRLAQIDLQRRAGDLPGALASAQAAAAALPDDPAIAEQRALLLQAAGDRNQAVSAWRRLAALPALPAGMDLRVAMALRALGAGAEAQEQVSAALKADPASPQAHRVAVADALQQGRPEQALELARQLQRRRPDEALGFELEGDAHSAQRQWDRAVAAYGKALTRREVGTAAVGMHVSLLQTKGPAEAARFQQARLKSHPDDAGYRVFLARQALAAGDVDAAEAHFRRVIELRPDSALAHNNLAHLLWKHGRPGGLPLAERAVVLAPQVPAFLDTLAMLLAANGQTERAVQTQRRALDLAADSPALRLNLVRLLVKAGDAAAAGDELAPLLRADAATARQTEVQQVSGEVRALLATGAGGRGATGARTQASVAGPTGAWLGWLLAALVVATVPAAAVYRAWQRVSYRVERVVEIGSTPDRLFGHLKDLRHWPSWSTVLAFGPEVERQFVGPEPVPGTVCDWSHAGRQRGRIEVDASEGPDRLVVVSTRAGAPAVRDLLTFRLAPAGPDGGTQLRCVSHGQAPWLARLLDPVLSIEARKGRQLDAELAALKRAAEAAMIAP
jgi:cellulose synthase operon protein C